MENKKRNMSNNNSLFLAFIGCLFSIIGDFFEFISAQSLVYIAIYGKSLFKSKDMGFKSLREKGFSKYIAGNIVSQLLFTFGFLIGLTLVLLGEFITYIVISDHFDKHEKIIFELNVAFSLLASFLLIAEVVNDFVGGYIACMVVLFLEDPKLMDEKCRNPNC